jgi:hypothetical protein
MKSTVVERKILGPLSSSAPGFIARGRLLFDPTDELFLRGILLDSSAYAAENLTGKPLLQPYFVPDDTIVFTVATSLGAPNPRLWTFESASEPDHVDEVRTYLETQVLPWLRRFTSPHDVADALRRTRLHHDELYALEVLAYSELLAERDHAAAGTLDRIAREGSRADAPPWAPESVERALQIQALKPSAARARLREWAAATRGLLTG